jgi:hypothetical protein
MEELFHSFLTSALDADDGKLGSPVAVPPGGAPLYIESDSGRAQVLVREQKRDVR